MSETEKRLSKSSLNELYDSGFQGFHLQERGFSFFPNLVDDIDLRGILEKDNAPDLIKTLPPQRLYLALHRLSQEDALEVLPHLTQEQFVRIFDYDIWEKDRLDQKKAFSWLKLIKSLGLAELYKRFKELDEEYQLSILGPFIKIYDEEEFELLEKTKQLAADFEKKFYRLPCQNLFYQIDSDDPEIHEAIVSVIEAGLGQDITWTYSLLSHAAYLPPNEQENLIRQFRTARLEEDGFISFYEGLDLFRGGPIEQFLRERDKYLSLYKSNDSDKLAKERLALLKKDPPGFEKSFLEMTIAAGQAGEWDERKTSEIKAAFLVLINGLCSGVRMTPDNISGLKILMEQAAALSSLGLEYLSSGDFGASVKILANEHPNKPFRAGLGLVELAQNKMLNILEMANIPNISKIKEYFTASRRGELLLQIDNKLLSILGFERAEILKGLFNRFPIFPVLDNQKTANSDHVNQDNKIDNISFKPIGSLADLEQLLFTLEQISFVFFAASRISEPRFSSSESLERKIATALGQAILTGTFSGKPFDEHLLSSLYETDRTKIETIMQKITKELLENFETSREEWSFLDEFSLKAKCPRILQFDRPEQLESQFAEICSDLISALDYGRERGLKDSPYLKQFFCVV